MAAKSTIQLQGVNNYLIKLGKVEDIIIKNVHIGMKRAGLFIQRKSMLIVPIQTGNLRASAFTRAKKSGGKFIVFVGYTASYAVFVHENLDNAHGAEFNLKHAERIAAANAGTKKGAKRDPFFFNRGVNQQAKFLEQPVRENIGRIIDIIRKSAEKRPGI